MTLRRGLQAYCRRRVCDRATAEDLTQEVLPKAFQGHDALRDAARLEAWLYRIAHGTVMDHYRRRPRPEPWECESAAEPTSDVTAVMTSNVRCYLETLPSGYRDAVHLADYEGLPHAEIDYLLRLQTHRTEAEGERALYFAPFGYSSSMKRDDPRFEVQQRNLFYVGRSGGSWFNPTSTASWRRNLPTSF